MIAHFHDGALDSWLWAGTVARIAAALGSNGTDLKLHGEDARIDLLECTDNRVVPDSRRAWAGGYGGGIRSLGAFGMRW